jgi:hypothetical protein
MKITIPELENLANHQKIEMLNYIFELYSNHLRLILKKFQIKNRTKIAQLWHWATIKGYESSNNYFNNYGNIQDETKQLNIIQNKTNRENFLNSLINQFDINDIIENIPIHILVTYINIYIKKYTILIEVDD